MDQLDKTKYKNLFDYTLYNVLLATGCRISEILALGGQISILKIRLYPLQRH